MVAPEREHLRVQVLTGAPGAGTRMQPRHVALPGRHAELLLGRRQGNGIELPFETISLLHARLFRNGPVWLFEDLGSANGSWIRGRRLQPRKPEILAPGDEVRLASAVVVAVETGDPGGASSDGLLDPDPDRGTDTIARRLVADLFGAAHPAEMPELHAISGPDTGAILKLTAAGRVHRIGRAPDSDLCLSDPDCSRDHALVTRTARGVVVRDAGSKNGVEIDGQRIAVETPLDDGAEFVVGGTRLRVSDPEARYLAKLQQQAVEAVPQSPPVAVDEVAEAPVPAAPVAPLGVARKPGTWAVTAIAVAILVGIAALGVYLIYPR